MNIDIPLFEKALQLIGFDNSVNTIKVTNKSIEFFNEIGLSKELIDFFIQFSYLYYFDFNGIIFNRVNDCRRENLNPINKEIYKLGLLIFGSGMNGDPVVLNLKTMKVGHVFHDDLWENSELEDLKSIYIDLDLSIGSFYYKAMFDDNFPIDAYEAKDFNQNIKT